VPPKTWRRRAVALRRRFFFTFGNHRHAFEVNADGGLRVSYRRYFVYRLVELDVNLNLSNTLKCAAVAAGALFVGASAHAGANWSVGINVPGVVYAAPGPAYYAPGPVYAPPVYYQPPPPVYYRPPPVYYRPAPVYYGAPAPVYYGPGYRPYRYDEHRRRKWAEDDDD